jgi:hypothetical protein
VAQSIEGQRVPSANGVGEAPVSKAQRKTCPRSPCAVVFLNVTVALARGTWLRCSDVTTAEFSNAELRRSEFARNRAYAKKVCAIGHDRNG